MEKYNIKPYEVTLKLNDDKKTYFMIANFEINGGVAEVKVPKFELNFDIEKCFDVLLQKEIIKVSI